MALIILKPSNFLLLDEPTNHLDLQSKTNLELALNSYKGTVLIISHDRFFISKVANRIVEIKNLCHSFSDKIIFFESNLKIISGEKVAFLGPNGVGKSTLFKLIMKQINPEIGEINLGKHNLITSYYKQNQSEALAPEKIIIDLIFEMVPDWPQKKVRTFLGGFGFYKDTVFKKVNQLSGGEKARLAMALIILQPSNFLLLDEPTNHLDLQSKANLEIALNSYKGTVLILSLIHI